MPLLEKLPVAVCVFHGNAVSHSEGHEVLIENQHPLLTEGLELSQRDGLSLGSLNNLLDGVRTVLLLPASDEFLGVVRVEPEASDVVVALDDEFVEVFVDLHHVENRALEDL